jgi:hypothetical protein
VYVPLAIVVGARRRGALPRGTFLLFADVLHLGDTSVRSLPLSLVQGVTARDGVLDVELTTGERVEWPGRVDDARALVAARGSFLSLLNGDGRALAKIDPLFEVRAVAHGASPPLSRMRIGPMVSVLFAVAFAIGFREARNACSDAAGLSAVLKMQAAYALEMYLECGGREVDEVKTVHLPHARRREALARGSARDARRAMVDHRDDGLAPVAGLLEKEELAAARGRDAATVWRYIVENPDATNLPEARAAYVATLAMELAEGRAPGFGPAFSMRLASALRGDKSLHVHAPYFEGRVVSELQELLDARLLLPRLVLVTGTVDDRCDLEIGWGTRDKVEVLIGEQRAILETGSVQVAAPDVRYPSDLAYRMLAL